MKSKLIDQTSYWVAFFTSIFAFFLFFHDTGFFWGSLSAAAMAAGLSWIGYVLVRWLILAFK